MVLGDLVRDKVSGFKGTIVCKHIYLHGGMRLTVQPRVDKDGRLPEAQTFDESQLEVIKEDGYDIKKEEIKYEKLGGGYNPPPENLKRPEKPTPSPSKKEY